MIWISRKISLIYPKRPFLNLIFLWQISYIKPWKEPLKMKKLTDLIITAILNFDNLRKDFRIINPYLQSKIWSNFCTEEKERKERLWNSNSSRTVWHASVLFLRNLILLRHANNAISGLIKYARDFNKSAIDATTKSLLKRRNRRFLSVWFVVSRI